MRTLAALLLSVSLSAAVLPTDWKTARDQGVTEIDRQNYAAAEAPLRASLSLALTRQEAALSSSDLGVALHQLGREAEAKGYLEKAEQAWLELPNQHRRLGRTAEALAVVLRNLGEYRASELLVRRTLADQEVAPECRAELLNVLGDLLREEGRSSEARRTFDAAAAAAADNSGAPWRALADAKIGLADLERDARSWDASLADWQSVVDLARRNQSTLVEAVGLRGLGQTWLERGSPAQAEPLLRRSLSLFENSRDSRGHQSATTLGTLAQLYIGEGKYSMAEDALMKAVEMDERTLGENHPQVGALVQMQADVAARQHDFDRARRYMDRAMTIMAARFGDQSAVVGSVFVGKARIEQSAGNLAPALAYYQRALELLPAGGPDLQSFTATVMQNCSDVLKQLHRKGEARALSAQAKTLSSGYRTRQ